MRQAINKIAVRFKNERRQELLPFFAQGTRTPVTKTIPRMISLPVKRVNLRLQRGHIIAELRQLFLLNNVFRRPDRDRGRTARQQVLKQSDLLVRCSYHRPDTCNCFFTSHDPVIEQDWVVDDVGCHAKAGRIANPKALGNRRIKRHSCVAAFGLRHVLHQIANKGSDQVNGQHFGLKRSVHLITDGNHFAICGAKFARSVNRRRPHEVANVVNL